MKKYVNINNLKKRLKNFKSENFFEHSIVDNFFSKKIAKKLEREFPKYSDKNLHQYNNFCEVKKSLNNWNLFPPTTYNVFSFLNSDKITKIFSENLNIQNLTSDSGLHGGGWHMMSNAGRLNPHLDYSIHPKMFYQRKYNLIIFLTNNWKKNWGGELCFYLKNPKNPNIPGKLFKKIYPKFNRAVIFDTASSNWHSVASIKEKKIRRTIAVYYLVPDKKNNISKRQRALYAPTKKQINNKKIIKFIKLRSSSNKFSKVYKTRSK